MVTQTTRTKLHLHFPLHGNFTVETSVLFSSPNEQHQIPTKEPSSLVLGCPQDSYSNY